MGGSSTHPHKLEEGKRGGHDASGWSHDLVMCVLCKCEGVDPIVYVNKLSHSASVWLNSANERCLWLGLARVSSRLSPSTHTHSKLKERVGG